MPDMQDAFDLARAIDGRLAVLQPVRPELVEGHPPSDATVDAFREALYDYRADGDLDAFIDHCTALLAEIGGDAGDASIEGRCFRALDSVFSSG